MNKKLAVLLILGCLATSAGCGSEREGAPDTTSASGTADTPQSQVEVVAGEQTESQADTEATETEQAAEISEEEQEKIFEQYVQDYYITGMLYDTWDNAEQIEVDRLLNFYRYNALFEKMEGEPDLADGAEFLSIPAQEVTGYITNRFDVDDAYLKTAANYDGETDTFQFPISDGIGGGPRPELTTIIRDGDLMTLCYEMEGTKMDLTIRLDGENYKYVSCLVS